MPSELDASIARWTLVPDAPAAAVTSARLQLHHAVQVANAPAMSYLPPTPDDSHTTFGWEPEVRAFVSPVVPLPHPRQFGWRSEELTLIALDARGKICASFALRGKTMAFAHDWARAECVRAGGDGERYTAHKHYEIPAHAVGAGAEFDASPEALRTLAGYGGMRYKCLMQLWLAPGERRRRSDFGRTTLTWVRSSRSMRNSRSAVASHLGTTTTTNRTGM